MFAYSVAIKLSVANLASQGVRMLAGDLLQAHGAATKLEDKLKALKLIAIGYGANRLGSGILGYLEKSVDVSKEYTRQLSLMNAAGMTQKDIAEATTAAWKTSHMVITSSAAENLEALRELRSVFGTDNMHEAFGILPTVMRTKGILEALTGHAQEGVAFDMVKAIELRTPGVMTEARMQSNADMMAQTLMAMGGTLNVNDFHMALKQAKTSAFGLSDDFVYKLLPTFMQEVKTNKGGAQSAGTALMTAYRAVIQGVLKKSAVPLWEQMGLISPNDVVQNATGGFSLRPGAVKGAQLFQSNPFEWANTVLAPAIDRIASKRGLNREQVLSGMFGDRNAQFFFNTLIGKSAQFERDRKLIESGGNSITTYNRLLKTNPQLAHEALEKQLENIHARIGYEILPRLIPYMIKFADLLDRFAQWMQRHPRQLQLIVFGLGGLGLTLSILGKVLMTAGIIKFLGMGPMIGRAFSALGTGLGSTLGLVTKLGPAIAVLGAAFAGWKIGSWINEHIVNPAVTGVSSNKNDTLGTFIARMVHGEPGEEGGSRYAAGKIRHPIQVKTQINLDGRKVAEVVTKHQEKAMAGPQKGRSTFDPVLAMAPVGASGDW